MKEIHCQELNDDITLIDIELKQPGIGASYLIQEGDKAALVETGTGHSTAILLEALRQRKVPLEAVEYVILTHIHLDHAGGAGSLMRHLPNARLVVHPRGARHMIDPSKLIAGAMAVYGEEKLRELFGEILSTPKDRIIEAKEGLSLSLGKRNLAFWDTPGHALHHCCIVDETSRGIFTGDTFGISYRLFDTEKGPFVSPSASPVQFDPQAAHASIDRIAKHGARYVYLTHYGRLERPESLAQGLHEYLDELVEIANRAEGESDRTSFLAKRLETFMIDRMRANGCTLEYEKIMEFWKVDLELNAQGLECWLNHRAARP